MRIRLNVGCGGDVREGWINMDINPGSRLDICKADIRAIPMPNGSVHELVAQDVLEHIPYADDFQTIRHWADKLAPGGTLTIRTPDMTAIIKGYQDGQYPFTQFVRLVFGGQEYETNFHKSGFNIPYLQQLVVQAGLVVEKCEPVPITPGCEATDGRNLILVARKP